MKLTHLLFLALVTWAGAATAPAFAQADSIESFQSSEAADRIKADELYFDAIKAKQRNDIPLATTLFLKFAALRPGVAATYYELYRLAYMAKDRATAEEYIRKAIAQDTSANKWYKDEYASALAERGAFDEAAKVAAQLAAAYPKDAGYARMAADFYKRAQKYDESLTYINNAITHNPTDEDLLLFKAQLYVEMNQPGKATETMQRALQLAPREGKYYKLLGDLYDEQKMPEKAREVYERGRKVLPTDPSIQLGLAGHFLKAGDTVAYRAYAREAILNKQMDSETQLYLFTSYMQSLPDGDVTSGMPIIRELALQNPDDPLVMELYGGFLAINGAKDSAAWAFKRSLTIKPNNFAVWEKLLSTYAAKEDADSLIKYSEKARKLFPNNVKIYYYSSVGYMNKKDYANAVKAINRAIDMQPDGDNAGMALLYSGLGDIYNTSGQYKQSDEAFDKAVTLEPANASTLNNYSYFLSVRGERLDDAERMSKKSLELQPGVPTFMDTYGWILYKKGNYAKAKEYIQKAIDLMGARADGTLYDHLGDVNYKLNDKVKATELWKLAKLKGAENSNIDKKISEGKLYE